MGDGSNFVDLSLSNRHHVSWTVESFCLHIEDNGLIWLVLVSDLLLELSSEPHAFEVTFGMNMYNHC